MAYDEGAAEILRNDLEDEPGISEKKMFGGLCFLRDGHMVCGVHKDGAMFRVGKDHEARARSVPGTGPMTFTGRPMGGMVAADGELLADDLRRHALVGLALDHARGLPPK